ncbi:hypothetical protein BSL78_10407 [Apostichopus japonicus]|uniref:C2H2-type domain-containing protein n=1 Tax=Stichopus japonicus TaxID=307972 RepID=A0A2G8KXJ9_STIJA|nr:hypothetical protein BSL78_10407 [Apostichopus japonicus]
MEKDKFEVQYCCTGCSKKFSKRVDLENHYKEKQRDLDDSSLVSIVIILLTGNSINTSHCRRHTENAKSKDHCTVTTDTYEVEPGHGSRKRQSNGVKTTPKVKRRENSWPSLDSLLGSPIKDIGGPNDGKDKREGKDRPSPPPTPTTTPAKKKNCQKTSPVITNPLAKQSNRQSPRSALSIIGEDYVDLEDDSKLEQRVTTNVFPDGRIKVVVERFQKIPKAVSEERTENCMHEKCT